MGKLRVVMAGATGKTGQEVARGLLAAPDMEMVAALGSRHLGRDLGEVLGQGSKGVLIYRSLDEVQDLGTPAVLVDFTHASVSEVHVAAAQRRNMAVVVGTTGLPDAFVDQVADECQRRQIGGAIVANFSLGAAMLSRLTRETLRFFPKAEIIELHSDHKKDRPSGTAKELARLMEAAGTMPPIHSVRLPGLVAHQEVIFGGEGEILTLRHDVHSRAAYAPGVLMAVRTVTRHPGLIRSMEDLLAAQER